MTSRTALDDDTFVRRWNQLDRRERSRLRRLVRMGKAGADRNEAMLMVAYATMQRARIWMRMFPVWFVPALIVTLGVATTLHPLVVGVVLALAAQAVFARINLGRAERVNRVALSR